ncbi:MAG: YfhO family protein [Lachnospiraceae bacterium]|nr:YfhO family protein [Lachnospiraceae bacterium]
MISKSICRSTGFKIKITEYILPAILIGVVFTAVLATNGLWPFGKQTIDYYDMAQQAEMNYYHNFDEIHGEKSLIFDWYTNLGRGIPGLSEPSLFDLLLIFFPRRYIPECMSVMMLVKIMFAAVFMGMFIRYINDELPYIFRLILASGYGLCGFVLMNYTLPQWIDMAALVPLVLMYSQKALKTGRFLGLSVTIFLIMILDFYFTIQMLMFVFLIGGMYSIMLVSDKESKERIHEPCFLRFLFGILAGLGLSAFSWLPDLVFTLTSARFGNGTEGGMFATYIATLASITPAYRSRWFSLLGLSAPAALAGVGISCRIRKKDIRPVIFAIACILFFVLQLFLESIHLILHFGSYVNYPLRNSFMIYCIVCGIAAFLHEKRDVRKVPDGRSKAGYVLCLIICVILTGVFKKWYMNNVGLSEHSVVILTMCIMLFGAAAHFLLISVNRGKYIGYCIFVWLVEMMIFGIIMIGKPMYDSDYGNDPEQEGEYIRIANQLTEAFGDELATGEDAATMRIKNPDTSLNSNYGVVMKRETLSGWTSFATSDQISGATRLGYSSQFTRILDSGGNIFSDTLLHISDVVSYEDLDGTLYEKVDTADIEIDHMTGERKKYHLYRNRFMLPFAIPIADRSALETDDPLSVINSYAKAMGEKAPIFSIISTEPTVENSLNHEKIRYEISVKGNKTLYFKGRTIDTDYYNTRISVNDKVIPVPSIHENDNDLFPAHFNNNTLELGSFCNEDVVIIIDRDISEAGFDYDFYLYEIDRDILSSLCDRMSYDLKVSRGKRSLDIELENMPSGYEGILIPVPYTNGWTAKTNGTVVDINGANGLFTYVPVTKGNVHLSYFPPYMKIGIITAVLFLGIIIAVSISDRRRKTGTSGMDTVLGYAYAFATAAVIAVIYIIPIVYAVFSLVRV